MQDGSENMLLRLNESVILTSERRNRNILYYKNIVWQ